MNNEVVALTVTEFWRAFGSAALILGGAFYAYVSRTNSKIQHLEGSVTAMKEKEKERDVKEGEQDKNIKSLQGREADEKVRDYRTDEIDRKLGALSEQVAAGFAEMRGAIAASNMQTALMIERQGHMQSDLEEVKRIVAKHERILATAKLPSKDGDGV